MKKIKKLLAILSAVTVIAVSSVCSVSAQTVKLYDVPDNITTLGELSESIKKGVWISNDDYLWLTEHLTIDELRELVAHFESNSAPLSDRLVEYLNDNFIYEEDFNLIYYQGALKIYETYETHYISPEKEEPIEIYDVPDNITTLAELEKSITEEVWISNDDWLMLTDHLTIDELRELVAYFNLESEYVSDELVEYLRENGIDEEEISEMVKIYYDGALQIYETCEVRPINPWEEEEINYGPSAPSPEPLTEKSGTFESGVTYYYNEETNGLIFDGKGELSQKDYCRAMNSFMTICKDNDFIFYGKDVTFECVTEDSALFMAYLDTLNEDWYGVMKRPLTPVYTYEGSGFARQFDEILKEKGMEKNQERFKYYTIEDGTDPYTFKSALEPIPKYISKYGRLGNDPYDTTWSYDGTNEKGGYFFIRVGELTENEDAFELDEILDIAKNYNVTTVNIILYDAGMSALPAELQDFDTIEEAEAELLRLINETKAEEQPTEEATEAPELTEAVVEETTEAVVEPTEAVEEPIEAVEEPTEAVVEPTEAVEEPTEAVVEPTEAVTNAVEVLADKVKEYKTEITLGDLNGDNKINIRDCAFIARKIAEGNAADLPDSADYNKDGVINIRDAAALAKELA